MNDAELPAYVTYTTDAIDRLSQSFQAALDRLATKDQLETVRLELRMERDARERLEASLNADELERKTKMGRLWATVWSLGGSLLVGILLNFLVVMHL